MKKALLGLMLVLVTGLLAPMAYAVEVDEGPTSMAQYFGADTTFFFAGRIDDAYLSELNSVLNRVLASVPDSANLPLPAELNLRALLEGQLAAAPFTLDELRGFLGDYVAVGISNYGALLTNDIEQSGIVIAVALSDSAALVSFLEANVPNLPRPTTEGDAQVYVINNETQLVINSDVLYIVPATASLPDRAATLNSAESFTNAIGALPADAYNIVGYFDYQALFTELGQASPSTMSMMTPEMMGLLPNDLALGLTILDDSVLTIDMVTDQMIEGVMTTPISSDFASNLPADTDLLVWGSDLGSYVNYTLTTLPQSLAAADPSLSVEDINQQIETALQQFEAATNIDLREDVLSWLTSDYALYTSVDLPELIKIVASASGGRFSDTPVLPVEFGFVAATSDAATTTETVIKVVTLLKAALANAGDEVTVTDLTDGPLTGVEISITAPVQGDSGTTSLSFLIGSNEDIFFVGTRGAFDSVQSGENLSSGDTYTRALSYAVPNQSMFVYADDEGITTFVGSIASLALLASSPNQMFSNITDTMQNPQTLQATPTPDTNQAQMVEQQLTTVFDTVNAIFDHAIISYGYGDNGYLVARLTLAFK